MKKNTKFAVVMSTYVRHDGKTEEHLTKALDSLLEQTHEDWKIFLTGDKFEDEELFDKMVSKIPKSKIKAVNRPFAPERDKYPAKSHKLWCSGGLSGTNFAIESALKEGFEYVCFLDHDDYWHKEHLSIFNEILGSFDDLVVLASRSVFGGRDFFLPRFQQVGYGYIPAPQNVIKASTCIRWNSIKTRMRDVFEETGVEKPSDMDFWERLSEEMRENDYKGYLHPYVTCYHLEEQSVMRGNDDKAN